MHSAGSHRFPRPHPQPASRTRLALGRGFSGIGQEPRRVLFFGKSRSRTRATSGFVEAFRAHGIETQWLNFARLRRRFGRTAAERCCRRVFQRWRPEAVFAVHPDLPLGLLREFARDVPVAQWVDQPLWGDRPAQVESLALSHVVFMTAPSRFSRLRELGIQRLVPMLEAFSPSDHRAHPDALDAARFAGESIDVAFIGGPGREGQRARELATIGARHPLLVHGNGWRRPVRADTPGLDVRGPVRPGGYRRLCRRARIVLGINEFNDEPMYFSNRTVLTLACGGFHLTRYVPGLEEVFTNREHLVWFHDDEECAALIEEFLAAPEERLRIARRGHALVHRRHRFVDRVGEVLRVLRTGTYDEQPWSDGDL